LRSGGAKYNDEKVFMSKDYLEMMWARNKFQLTILELGFNFLFTVILQYIIALVVFTNKKKSTLPKF
jgi:Nucleotide-diphospho-sugar transferase